MDLSAELEIRSLIYGEHLPERELPSGIVHVWQQSLQGARGRQESYELLSEDERKRALRYKVESARNDFIVTRAALRSLIAVYLGRDPRGLVFQAAPYGKLFLRDSDLLFNVSHTDGLALLAFVHGRQIGVDVEKIRSETEAGKLAERFFSATERKQLRNLKGHELRAAFFRCWTRKEAYIKARGEGLSLPLSQFDVGIATGGKEIDLTTRPDPAEAGRWLLRDLETRPGYAAAVAIGKTAM